MKKFFYNEVYWGYIAIYVFLSLLMNGFSVLLWVYLLAFVLFLYTCYMLYITHKALKEAGSNWGWLLGLVLFLPLGIVPVFFVVRWKLKPLKKWSRKD